MTGLRQSQSLINALMVAGILLAAGAFAFMDRIQELLVSADGSRVEARLILADLEGTMDDLANVGRLGGPDGAVLEMLFNSGMMPVSEYHTAWIALDSQVIAILHGQREHIARLPTAKRLQDARAIALKSSDAMIESWELHKEFLESRGKVPDVESAKILMDSSRKTSEFLTYAGAFQAERELLWRELGPRPDPTPTAAARLGQPTSP